MALEKKLKTLRITEAIEGPADDSDPHKRPLCFQVQDAVNSAELLQMTNGNKGRLIKALHKLNS